MKPKTLKEGFNKTKIEEAKAPEIAEADDEREKREAEAIAKLPADVQELIKKVQVKSALDKSRGRRGEHIISGELEGERACLRVEDNAGAQKAIYAAMHKIKIDLAVKAAARKAS